MFIINKKSTMAMMNNIVELNYPITFRSNDAQRIGENLKNRNSIVLIGMKRVGISNFLRFFLYHNEIVPKYIGDNKSHLFIPIDLNDLVERETYSFWRLTLKRIVDATAKTSISGLIKKRIESFFLSSIQSRDLFTTIDCVRDALVLLVNNNILPTLFFIRFDRMKNAINQEFFHNLQGLKDATHQNLAYVFTSSRSLGNIAPEVFTKASLAFFCQDIYIKPTDRKDSKIIFKTYSANYRLSMDPAIEEAFFDIVDGYVQYLHLALIFLHEAKLPVKTRVELFDGLLNDERIYLQSEELWESLILEEKNVLLCVSKGKDVSRDSRMIAKYLWDTGFIIEKNNKRTLFSPLFGLFLKQQELKENKEGIDFTKKEHLLFTYLSENKNNICEREKIVEAVWPEMEEMGVSDWAIDRLVARVRGKLRLQKSNQAIQTIRTRGYKLIML